MGMGTSSGGGIQSDINVTPLVDVVLVLLIIFMVAQPMLQRGYDSAIPRSDNLPPPDPTAPQPPSFVLRLAQDRNSGTLGAIMLNTETVSRADLKEKVRNAMLTVGTQRDKVVFIDCADDVNYDQLMQVVDELKEAGVATVGFATEPIAQ